LIFSGLENIRKEKRNNLLVVSLLFGSLSRLKMDFYIVSVLNMLIDNIPHWGMIQ